MSVPRGEPSSEPPSVAPAPTAPTATGVEAEASRWRRWARVLLYVLAVAVAGGVGFWLWRQHRVAFDDAWISFRYADNLIRGRGLVYNPGERVEGYTNLLWVLLTALGMALKLEPLLVARVLGLGALLGQAALVAWLLAAARRRLSVVDLGLACLPTLLVLAASHVELAGAGLETSLFGLLALATLVLFNAPLGEGGRALRWLRALVPLALVMTRLDGALFLAASGLSWLLFRGAGAQRARAVLRDALRVYGPAAGLIALLLLFKLIYYGGVLPNTYYAKAAYLNSWDVGWLYLSAFMKSYPGVWLLLLLSAVALGATRTGPWRPLVVALGLSLTAFVVYVAKAGGDFMEYRFMFETYASLVALAGLGVVVLGEVSPWSAPVVGALLLILGRGAPVMEKTKGMQSLDEMDGYARQGVRVGTALGQRLPADTVISTTLAGTMSFFSDLKVVDQLGLNDYGVAHQPYKNRSIHARGHVKWASLDYLRGRGVSFAFHHPGTSACERLEPTSTPQVFIRLDDVECVRSDALTIPPALLDYVCGHPEQFSLHGVSCPEPPVLYAPSEGPAPARAEEAARRRGRWLPEAALRFETTAPLWVQTGDAFEGWPMAEQTTRTPPVGAIGKFITSYHPTRGDGATGTLTSAPFRIEGDVIALRVGGGNDPRRLRVSLLVNGKEVRSATGRQTETLAPRFWDVAPWRGAEAQLEIVDQVRGRWGHIIVDELTQFQSEP